MRKSWLAKVNNKRGFSLTELLTVVLLLVVLTLGITVMITSGINTYKDSLYISEVSSVESMINKALARELRYAEPTELTDGGNIVREFKIGSDKYTIGLNAAGYLVETKNGTETVQLLNIGSYANMHVTKLTVSYSGKVFTCNYTIRDKGGTKEKDVSYTVRTAVFLREGWTPGKDPDPPVVPTAPPPKAYHWLTIEYYIVEKDSERLINTFKHQYYEDDEYSVVSQPMEGYTVEPAVVKGTMGKEDITKRVEYRLTEYKINYLGLEGASEPTKKSYTSHDSAEGDIILDPPGSRTGYTFEGWYTDEARTKKTDRIPQFSAGDKTFYANWTINQYTITFDSKGGSSVASITQDYGTVITAPANPTKAKSTFQYWYRDDESQSYPIPTTMPAENITLHAKWMTTFTITYKPNATDARANPSTKEFKNASSGTVNSTASRSNWEFEGWNTAADGSGTMYQNGATVPAEDLTLYAIWSRSVYVVTQNAELDVEIKVDGKTIASQTNIRRDENNPYVFSDVPDDAYIYITARYDKNYIHNLIAYGKSTDDRADYKQSPEGTTSYTIDGSTIKGSIAVVGYANNKGWCLAEGTLITLADGSQKPIEDITPQDDVLVFNHVTGEIEVSHLMIDYHSEEQPELTKVMNLVFDNGAEIKVIIAHGFFDSTLNKYVNISEYNYEKFVGDAFYTNTGDTAKLSNVYFTEEMTRRYAPVSEGHVNVFADGILSISPCTDHEENLFTFFDLDENMRYDRVAMARDILKYGLYTYKDFEPYGIPKELFEAVPAKYLKIAVGKGLISFDEIVSGTSEYIDLFTSTIKE